jgi:branched-chain amino acid transport system substrate-binding protein
MKASRLLQAATVVALSLGFQNAADAQAIRLGFMSSMSGPIGSLGPEQRRGMDLALEDLGGKLGGLPVEVLVADDEGDAKAAVAAASKLIDKDKVDLITGIMASPALLGAAKTFTDSGLIVISANAGPSVFAGKGCNPNFFFTGFQNDQGDEAVGLFLNDHGYKRVFYVGFDNQAGYDHTPQSQLEYAAEIAKIRSAKPDAVFAFYVGAAGVAFVKQYGQSGLKDKARCSPSRWSTRCPPRRRVRPPSASGWRRPISRRSTIRRTRNSSPLSSRNTATSRPSTSPTCTMRSC